MTANYRKPRRLGGCVNFQAMRNKSTSSLFNCTLWLFKISTALQSTCCCSQINTLLKVKSLALFLIWVLLF